MNTIFGFEKLILSLSSKSIPKDSDTKWDDLVKCLSSTAHTAFTDFEETKHSIPKLPPEQIQALKNLRADTSITITRPDKGRGIVILDKEDYINEIQIILNDTSKFTPISEDAFTAITRVEDKLQRHLRTLFNEGIITKDTYNHLYPAGSSPGILYGLPKTHKKGKLTFRPILSALGTFSYKLAKFLVPILEPLTLNEFTIKNSFEFATEITNINPGECVMASFDVESLFTNIPLQETINIITDSLFKEKLRFKNFKKPDFTKLLTLAVKDSPFVFNNKLYVQKDGVSMGNPLGPTFANAFLAFHEQTWLDNCPPDFKPLLYKRYVDDSFLLFRHPNHISKFQTYLNNKHPNINFTVEQETEGKLPFLDILLIRNENSISTSIYRKSTFSGLGLNFTSFVPEQFKINAIKTLLFRCYNICSNWDYIHTELEFLTNFFQNNKFPLHLIQRNIRNFLNKTFSPHPKPNKPEEKPSLHYIGLPYYGTLSYDIRKKLNRILKLCFPKTTFRFIFSNPNTIGSLFRHKEPLPPNLISNIVYQFNCPSCKARYIGLTQRNLTLRVAEHKGLSARTGRPVSHPLSSAVRNHSVSKNHPYCISDFKIIHKARNDRDLPILESLYIKHLTPELNNYSASVTLHSFKFNSR